MLLLDPAVTLFFEFDPESYLITGKPFLTRYEGTTLYSLSPCIRAFRTVNVIIEAAKGTDAPPSIDGDGEKWQQRMEKTTYPIKPKKK